ncbi:unnamed protein product, partial [marine sediment metagenome]
VAELDAPQELAEQVTQAATTRTNARTFFDISDWPNAQKYYANLQTQCRNILDLAKAQPPAPTTPAQVELPKPPAWTLPKWAEDMIWDGGISKAQQDAADALDLPVGRDVELRNGLVMRFMLIPSGRFTMGSDTDEARERPAHEVQITKAFYMGMAEVSQGQWTAVMRTKPWRGRDHASWSATSCPANWITWREAAAFAGAVKPTAGGTCRLPTEAEWEYACRAGSTTQRHFAEDESRLGYYAWYEGNTSAVGSERPQPTG